MQKSRKTNSVIADFKAAMLAQDGRLMKRIALDYVSDLDPYYADRSDEAANLLLLTNDLGKGFDVRVAHKAIELMSELVNSVKRHT